MSDDDAKFSELRKEGKTYLSKVFTHAAIDLQRRRFAHAVFEGTERAVLASVARMERSAIRDLMREDAVPDFASLHPGYSC